MGQKMQGATPRDSLVAFRLNTEEADEMVRKMGIRGIREKSAYFRTLMHEDGAEMDDTTDEAPEPKAEKPKALLGSGPSMVGPTAPMTMENQTGDPNDDLSRRRRT